MPDVHLVLHRSFAVGDIDRRLFGGFVEHLGRHVYDGIYEPLHPSADVSGFRSDVRDLVRELGVTTLRYPGGNFVSGLRWEDTVGAPERRPRRLDTAWHSTETNEVGLHEFEQWAKSVGSELMLAVNLGTRGVQEALDLLEYCNVPGGSALSEMRRVNGRSEPFDVRMWCLGNEMDGSWQLGHKSADEYGRLAAMTARALRQLDDSLELVASGSSGRWMPTFGAWERTVLEHAYEEVDFISAHAYYAEADGDADSFLASPVDMDRQIDAIAGTIDHVRAVRHSDHEVAISFDEWNVWYQDRYAAEKASGLDNWPIAPRILEDRYNVTDAVVVGGLLISLLNHCDRVKAASLAQLVNVIAPIMTEPGGPAWRQTTFHPFAVTAAHARGRALRVLVDGPLMTTARYGEVPVVDAAATVDGAAAAIFIVNRQGSECDATIDVAALGAEGGVDAAGIWDTDRFASNTLLEPDRVGVRANPSLRRDGGTLSLTLPPRSWTAITFDANE